MYIYIYIDGASQTKASIYFIVAAPRTSRVRLQSTVTALPYSDYRRGIQSSLHPITQAVANEDNLPNERQLSEHSMS